MAALLRDKQAYFVGVSLVSAVEIPVGKIERGRLLRILGFAFGVAVIVGNTIGVGILRTPGDVAARLPTPGLFLGVWILGALFVLLAAMNITELGVMLPSSGGHYTFARYALGEYPGFVIGWTDWLSCCGSNAAAAVVMGEYLGLLFPLFAGKARLIGAVVLILLAAVQWQGVRWGSGFQQFSTLLKGIAFLVIVAACFLFAPHDVASAVSRIELPHGWPLFAAVLLAMQSMIYTYDGWAGVIYFSEEVEDPARNIPRSMFGGAIAVATIYIAVAGAIVYVLPIGAVAGHPMALGAAADLIWKGNGTRVIAALTVLSVISFMNACHLMTSRILYAMARDKVILRHADIVNRGGTPTVALALSTAAALLFIAYGGFSKIIAVLAFFFAINYIADFISIFVLRKREPNRERLYRVPGYPWTTILALLIYSGFLASIVAADLRNSVYSLLLLAGSYPAFRALKRIAA
ncbi:MAG: APC family permease [Acidobacteria bacterium]|nr:APC family permease [Acidobacteriota bacterium]